MINTRQFILLLLLLLVHACIHSFAHSFIHSLPLVALLANGGSYSNSSLSLSMPTTPLAVFCFCPCLQCHFGAIFIFLIGSSICTPSLSPFSLRLSAAHPNIAPLLSECLISALESLFVNNFWSLIWLPVDHSVCLLAICSARLPLLSICSVLLLLLLFFLVLTLFVHRASSMSFFAWQGIYIKFLHLTTPKQKRISLNHSLPSMPQWKTHNTWFFVRFNQTAFFFFASAV